MKTVGEVLKNTRLKKGITLESVAKALKTKTLYLASIEANNFSKLPSPTLVKGLIRRYATHLELDPETTLALFRRDFKITPTGKIFPYKTSQSPRPLFLDPKLLLTIGFFTGLLLFLGFQLYIYFSLPRLELIEPVNGNAYLSPIPVIGKTSPSNTIFVNGKPVLVSQNGKFSTSIPLPPGTHSVVVQAKSKNNKTRTLQRTFEVVEK